jgi:2-iminobutanoate/2-iminopropanoate deaminase
MLKTMIAMLVLAVGLCSAQTKKKIILPEGATSPGKNFPPGLLVGDTLYISAYIGYGPDGKIPPKFEDEVQYTLDHVGAVLKAAKMNFEDCVSVQVYLTDYSLFEQFNTVYLKTFKTDPKPTRTTVVVTHLIDNDRGAHIAMTVTAKK